MFKPHVHQRDVSKAIFVCCFTIRKQIKLENPMISILLEHSAYEHEPFHSQHEYDETAESNIDLLSAGNSYYIAKLNIRNYSLCVDHVFIATRCPQTSFGVVSMHNAVHIYQTTEQSRKDG